jgi:hypothetical protein
VLLKRARAACVADAQCIALASRAVLQRDGGGWIFRLFLLNCPATYSCDARLSAKGGVMGVFAISKNAVFAPTQNMDSDQEGVAIRAAMDSVSTAECWAREDSKRTSSGTLTPLGLRAGLS